MRAPTVNLNGGEITLYEFFGVSENCNDMDLKNAYRKLCFKYHPDRNISNKGQAEQNFKVVQNVWGFLMTPEKRKSYDRQLAIDRGQIQEQSSVFIQFVYQWNGQTQTATTSTW